MKKKKSLQQRPHQQRWTTDKFRWEKLTWAFRSDELKSQIFFYVIDVFERQGYMYASKHEQKNGDCLIQDAQIYHFKQNKQNGTSSILTFMLDIDSNPQ